MHDRDDHSSRASHPPLTIGEPSPLRSSLSSITWMSSSVRHLADLVGGLDALEALDVVPVPTESFDGATIDVTARAVVTEVLAEIDRVLGPGGASSSAHAVDHEHRAIARRVLVRAVERDPRVASRSTPIRVAAAAVWLAMHGNDHLRKTDTMTAAELWTLFGVTNCTDIGRSLHRACGLVRVEWEWGETRNSDVWLSDARLLHSRQRARLVHRRGDLIATIEAEFALGAARHRVTACDGARYLTVRPVSPTSAATSMIDGVQPVVVVGLDANRYDPEMLGMTVPDARRLVSMVSAALDSTSRPFGTEPDIGDDWEDGGERW